MRVASRAPFELLQDNGSNSALGMIIYNIYNIYQVYINPNPNPNPIYNIYMQNNRTALSFGGKQHKPCTSQALSSCRESKRALFCTRYQSAIHVYCEHVMSPNSRTKYTY